MSCCSCCDGETATEEATDIRSKRLGISNKDLAKLRDDDANTEIPPEDDSDNFDFTPLSTPRAPSRGKKDSISPPMTPPVEHPNAPEPEKVQPVQAPPTCGRITPPTTTIEQPPPVKVLEQPTPVTVLKQPPPVKILDQPPLYTQTEKEATYEPKKLSDMTPAEKEKEKHRLQVLVKEFAKKAVDGINVQLVDAATGQIYNVTFSMNSHLSRIDIISAQPLPKTALSSPSISMSSVTAVYKGSDVINMHAEFPLGAEEISDVVGLSHETLQGPTHLFFFFTDPKQRNTFYVCTRILQLSARMAK